MRYSLVFLSLFAVALTACAVPPKKMDDSMPQEPAVREQMDAIEKRRNMEAMKDAEQEEVKEEMVDVVKQEPKEPIMQDSVVDQKQYTAYSDGVIGNGMESVLFFHAAWCPACQKNDGLLTSWYASEDFARSVYKVDFDTASDLRKQFGVNGQDTFILIDANGNEIDRVSFPSESALRALLG